MITYIEILKKALIAKFDKSQKSWNGQMYGNGADGNCLYINNEKIDTTHLGSIWKKLASDIDKYENEILDLTFEWDLDSEEEELNKIFEFVNIIA